MKFMTVCSLTKMECLNALFNSLLQPIILCYVSNFQLSYSLYNQGYRSSVVSVVTFTNSQPLGFFSSSPLFTLTH